ncbi:hypothetical protein IQ235_04890 [Oscillatoriales cyanobacterium LEGE 11467]|uniref:Uncharacterized protein n=1 Tax=Zarconia navalis LEGE 11467 TaxID=1828826 RepID=A0A928VTM0_9CYAN|nr:hypothetical protein [Zarconia navalis]MBE9040129.1 hypothetical protein [Zarconia navalis LEGE 11467]
MMSPFLKEFDFLGFGFFAAGTVLQIVGTSNASPTRISIVFSPLQVNNLDEITSFVRSRSHL